MADHYLNFRPYQVRAALDGRLSQTRLVVSPTITLFNGWNWPKWTKGAAWDWARAWVDNGPSPAENPGPYLHLPFAGSGVMKGTAHRIYPKIQPGDRICVREAWADIRNDPVCDMHGRIDVAYRASHDDEFTVPPRWRPSIHMPRWASRITLLVTDVRVQRLWQITNADAVAEGIKPQHQLTQRDGGAVLGAVLGWGYDGLDGYGPGTAKAAYALLWNSLHGPGAWEKNPWVAALTFEVHRCNIDKMERGDG